MRLPIVSLLLTFAAAAQASEVVDSFENGANPNGWSWAGSDPAMGAGINAGGGDPAAWLDSGAPYIAFEPQFAAEPPPGSPLRAALDSAKLRTASIDLQRLDVGGVPNCFQQNDGFKSFAFDMIDTHSGSLPIEGRSTLGPASPGDPYPWTHVSFVIPSASATTPRGWTLTNAPDGYTWADLMHNIDAVEFFALASPFLQPGACWHLGADNVVITYGDADRIFASALEGADGSGPVQDPGFEATAESDGTNPAWTSADSNPLANGRSVLYSAADTGIAPHGGNYVAWFGGWNSGSESQYISQTVTLPAGGPLYVNYYRATEFQVDTSSFPANLTVSIDGTAVETTDLGTQGDVDYALHSIDVSAFADGASHELRFQYDYNRQDSQSDGSTFVDDVTIDPTPTPGHR
ncbi:MAG TPA: hypothetical protein VKB52_04340 [Rhodanobacteraceae bacterium]|nr:hypothetical protein [Rhodanobacteraceae bacterium]